MKRKLLFLLLCCLPSFASAGYDLKWTETEVVLDRDGRGQVSYAVRWGVTGREIHAFYFEGAAEPPVFDRAGAYAVDDRGERYDLDIKHVSGRKYDIVLAGGRGFGGGDITFFFRYAADFQAGGTLTQTMAGERRLAVFNWSPVQWDEPLEHMTVKVVYPAPLLPGETGEAAASRLSFMTEKFVNERFLIDYPETVNEAGERLFTVRYHKKDAGTRFHMRTQTYVDAGVFDLQTMASAGLLAGTPKGPWRAAPENYYLGRYFPGGMLATLPITRGETLFLALVFAVFFGVLPFVVMTRKHNSMLVAQAGISEVNWEGTEWEPPKAQVSSFRKPGKVAKDLSPIEAGVILGLPLTELGGLILGNMERKGLLKITGTDPLRVSKPPHIYASNDPYETLLLGGIKPDGSVDEAALKEMVKSIAAGMEQKIWDADLEATKAYYRKKAETAAPAGAETDHGYYWGGYRRRFLRLDDRRYENTASVGEGLKGSLGDAASLDFETFRTSRSCYEGAFARDAC
ncbi:MAG TPA: hypothetical protein DDW67_03450, partial [Elusimicrobia bacterium]|nr:hypothetical protein [Elusimicrobiota bacterium]